MGPWRGVKTTVDIPDNLFWRAKSAAVKRGIPFRALVTKALAEKLRTKKTGQRPWMNSFGKLKALHKQTVRIERIIQEEFGQIERKTGNDSRHECRLVKQLVRIAW